MSGDMWLCAVVACAVLIIALIVLLVRMRRKTDHEMLYSMAGPVRGRVDGRLQVGHRKAYDGHVTFGRDGMVVGFRDGDRFVPYRKVRDIQTRERSVRMVIDGIGSVTMRGPRRVSKDVQVLACELAGKTASDLGE